MNRCDQIYYSLESDPDFCARSVANLILADLIAQGKTAHRPKTPLQEAAYELGKWIGQVLGGWLAQAERPIRDP
ncbi:MAG: hypothetical protein ACREIQ_06020 [Nitrospiria bacterium]